MSGVNFPSNNFFVGSENKIDKKDCQDPIKASSPLKNDTCLEKEEVKFPNDLKSVSNTNTAVTNSGSSDASIDLFTDEVPPTLEETWKKVSSDGKISKEDYVQLLKTAAPNMKDQELDEKEISFLTNIKTKLTDVGDKVGDSTGKPAKTEKEVPVPKSLEETWKKVSGDGNKISKEDYQLLLKEAAPNKKNSEFDEGEIAFLKSLKDNLTEK